MVRPSSTEFANVELLCPICPRHLDIETTVAWGLVDPAEDRIAGLMLLDRRGERRDTALVLRWPRTPITPENVTPVPVGPRARGTPAPLSGPTRQVHCRNGHELVADRAALNRALRRGGSRRLYLRSAGI